MQVGVVKKMLLMSLAAIGMSVPLAFAQDKPLSTVRELSNAEFDALAAKPESLTIIDLRQPDELTNVGGFPVYLSIQSADLEKSLAWIPKDRVIVTVSNTTARSGRAAELLSKHGFKVAGTIGARTYQERGGKLTKLEPRQPRSAAASQGAAK